MVGGGGGGGVSPPATKEGEEEEEEQVIRRTGMVAGGCNGIINDADAADYPRRHLPNNFTPQQPEEFFWVPQFHR